MSRVKVKYQVSVKRSGRDRDRMAERLGNRQTERERERERLWKNLYIKSEWLYREQAET